MKRGGQGAKSDSRERAGVKAQSREGTGVQTGC